MSETSFDDRGVTRVMGLAWQSGQQVEVDRVLWEALCSPRDAGHNNNNNNNNNRDVVEDRRGDKGREVEDDNNNININNNNLKDQLVNFIVK